MFVRIGSRLINEDEISTIHINHLVDDDFIQVKFRDGRMEVIEGMDAFHLINELAPEALEGRKAKYVRHAWAVHNLLGHPLMQICSWLGLPKLGIKIHDMTTPFPITKE